MSDYISSCGSRKALLSQNNSGCDNSPDVRHVVRRSLSGYQFPSLRRAGDGPEAIKKGNY